MIFSRIFLISLLILLKTSVLAVEMLSINPPIEKWNQRLIVSREAKKTGNTGHVAITLGRDLLIVDANTGKQKQKIPIGYSQYTVTKDGRIYIAEYETGLKYFNLSKEAMRKQIPDDKLLINISQPILYNSKSQFLYAITDNDGLYILKVNNDRHTIAKQISTDRFQTGQLAQLIDKGRHEGLLTASANGILTWIPATLEEEKVKSFAIGGHLFFPPIYFAGKAYALVLGNILKSIDLDGGQQQIWEYALPGVATANVAMKVINEQIYAYIPIDRTLHAFQIGKNSCRLVWEKEFQQTIVQPVSFFQELLLVSDTEVVALSALDGKEKWTYNQKIDQEKEDYIFRLENRKNRRLTPAELQEVRGLYPRMETVKISAPLQIEESIIYCSVTGGQIFAFSAEEESPVFFYWLYKPEESLELSPYQVDSLNLILVGSTKGTIYAVSTSGELKKTVKIGNDPIVGFEVGEDNTFYILTQKGRLYKRNLPNLSPAAGWQSPVNMLDEVQVPPILHRDGLHVASIGKQKIYSFDVKNRRQIGTGWSIGSPMKSKPRLINNMMVIGTDSGEIQGIQFSSDNSIDKVFNIDVKNPVSGGISKPNSNGQLYVGDEKGKLHVLSISPNSGALTLDQSIDSVSSPIRSTPVLDGISVYITHHDGTIVCIRGSVKRWEQKPADQNSTPLDPIVYDDQTLLVPFENGYIYALSKSDGRILWHYSLSIQIKASPIFFNGDIFIVTQLGNLLALRPELWEKW